ncbi:unnamed protein product [Ceratitis capitata]|uniref:(Mediterranean fruit fly) hypothetical protein n=1 Tax=Ceratitis capitata TaxID=7213 RepID=A0A811V2Z7_CERCA|nr:unnamed protein product [Ceratitis capitata]
MHSLLKAHLPLFENRENRRGRAVKNNSKDACNFFMVFFLCRILFYLQQNFAEPLFCLKRVLKATKAAKEKKLQKKTSENINSDKNMHMKFDANRNVSEHN